jgi:hypothetical protein
MTTFINAFPDIHRTVEELVVDGLDAVWGPSRSRRLRVSREYHPACDWDGCA